MKNIGQWLEPEGIFCIRDFFQPANADQQIRLQLGSKKPSDPMDPLDFTDRFSKDAFGGVGFPNIAKQIQQLKNQHHWKPGAQIHMSLADAYEFMIHFSWAQNYQAESRERYGFMTIDQFVKKIIDAWEELGIKAVVETKTSYSQPEYESHILGRMNLFRNGEVLNHLPKITGNLTIRRTN